MKFYFVDSKGNPVVYNALVPGDAWTQNKGQKSITVIRSSCWSKMARIGGVVDEPSATEVQVQPTEGNLQTIGIKYTVKRGDEYFTGFGSSNQYSVIKQEHTFNNNDGTKKVVVSGNALHAFEMAVKRAKVAAIASALGFEHGEAREIMESADYILHPELRQMVTIEYSSLSFEDLQRVKHTIVPVGQVKTTNAPASTGAALPPVAPLKPPVTPPPPQNTQPSKPPTVQPPPPAVNKPVTPPPTPPAKQTPPPVKPAEQVPDNPGEVILNFGEFNGKALITVLGLKPSYITWLAKEARDPKIKAAAAAVVAQHPNLATAQNDKPGNEPPAEDKHAGSRDKLKQFWASRGYDPKTEVKKILSDAMQNPSLSWNIVTEEDAAKLYDRRESLFPPKGGNLMEPAKKPPLPPATTTPAPQPDNTQATDKECKTCGKKLYPIEIDVSTKAKDKTGGELYCFEHINIVTGGTQAPEAPKCKACSKPLREDELEFIAKYGGDALCMNCQQPK